MAGSRASASKNKTCRATRDFTGYFVTGDEETAAVAGAGAGG
jgi:hypothetical protein